MRLKIITCRRTARRFLEVRIEHLQVMLRGDAFGVSQPRRHDVSGELFREFRLT